MNIVRVEASRGYDVLIGSGILQNVGVLLAERIRPQRICLITDDIVDGLYAAEAAASFERAGFAVCIFVFPHGEQSKSMDTLAQMLSFLARNGLMRGDCVAALGGGVCGDLAGFAAASYLRGIPFVQIPTTLLAAVDSSVGGKTGVNLPEGKNLAGAFWQPSLVVCDCDVFNTLKPDAYADGISEAIKCGMIADKTLFDLLAGGMGRDDLPEVVCACVAIKRDVVQRDEFDNADRQLLNFGHTVGHAIERQSSYQITHGHAVAIGMAAVTRASHKLGLCGRDCLDALLAVLRKYDLPTACPYTATELASAMLRDKKRKADTITLIIPEEIGRCRLHPIAAGELEDFVRTGLETGEV